jgi:uncharacterized protein DUF4159
MPRSTATTVILAMLALLCAAAPVAAQTDLDKRIDAAIAAGLKWTWAQQKPSGLFSNLDPANVPETNRYPGDRTVMAMVSLAYAGFDPAKNADMKRGLKAMMELSLEKTYTAGFRIIALAEMYRQTSDKLLKTGIRQGIKLDAAFLIDSQMANGAWYYYHLPRNKTWDFSNTQIAVLALHEARSIGIEVPREVFQKVLDLYLAKQRDDGGWNYGRPGAWELKPSYRPMTAAAVASVFICRDALQPGQGCPCRNGRSAGRRDPRVQQALNRGVAWLGKHFKAREARKVNYYWLYAAERVAQKTGLKYFGQHNWYREGAEAILSRQARSGSRSGSWGRFADTSFALLFLIKGRGPVLTNKLLYDGPWDLHPYDLANLATFVGKAKEQRFNWQVIHLNIPVAEMHDSPILLLSTEKVLELSDEHKKKLREFTDTGGTILLEPSCGNRAVARWIEKLCREIWPEWELKVITKEHPLWTADTRISGRLPALKGLTDGLRTFVFYTPRDITCAWHTKAVARQAALFKLGGNLYVYATDRAKIRSRFTHRQIGTGAKYAGQPGPSAPAGSRLVVARMIHGGAWHIGRRYHPWQVLGKELAGAGLTLTTADPVAAGADVPADVGMLYLAGYGQVALSDKATAALKAYATRGGFLFAEATAGDAAFDTSVRAALKATGLSLKPLGETSGVLSGRLGDGVVGYAVGTVGYTYALRKERLGRPAPLVYGIYLGEKLVGVYSPFDILFAQTGCKAYDLRGYDSDDARALAVNIALQAVKGRPEVATPEAAEPEAETDNTDEVAPADKPKPGAKTTPFGGWKK